MNLRYRILLIAGLVVASIFALFPRNVVERVRTPNGFEYDTVKRVPLKKGLDLEGGMHLALAVDESKGVQVDKSKAIENALKVVRNRIDQFGVSEPVIQKAGNDRIIVDLPGIDDERRAQDVVQKSAFLEFQITDKTQAFEKSFAKIDAAVKQSGILTRTAQTAKTPATTTGDTSGAARAGLQNLLTADTSKKPDTARKDSAKIDTAITAGGDFSKLIQQGQMPGEYFVAKKDADKIDRFLSLPQVQAALPPGKVLRWGSDSTSLANNIYRPLYVLDARPIITGEYLKDARPVRDPQEGTLVTFELNNEGGRRFRTETAKHLGDYMAIVLDQRVMGRPPVIQGVIGTRGQITMGGKDLQDATDLALVLRAGSLPVPLKVEEIRTIGPSLGRDSISKGITAGVIAIILIVTILLSYYRFSGLLAVVGMCLYVLFTLAALAGFNAALTLPGLAGFVLSIGIAVDANVLIFERIREELDRGKTVRTAVDEGFRHAMTAIIDSNVSTALTAAVLYQYGTGPVRGFAVTLLAGIAASMISAIFVVRTFYMIWLTRAKSAQTLSI